MKHFPAEPLHICHRFYPKRSAAFLCCVDLTLPCIIKPAEEDKQDKIHTFPYETQKGVLELLNQWAVNKEERECVWKRSWSLFSLLQNHRNRLLIVSDELLDHSWILGGSHLYPWNISAILREIHQQLSCQSKCPECKITISNVVRRSHDLLLLQPLVDARGTAALMEHVMEVISY